jgi:hypothetical protein
MSNKFFIPTDMGYWSQSIGGLIINFGIIEFLTLRWIEVLGGDQAALDARKSKLANRINSVLALIPNSALSSSDKKQAGDLWDEVLKLTATRNRIAHNPLCIAIDPTNQLAVLSVVDLKIMTPKGQNPLERLDRTKIADIGLRVGAIGRLLSDLLTSLPNG